MSIHLDTNVAIEVINGTRPGFRTRLRRLRSEGQTVQVSAIVVFELWFGVAAGTQFENDAAEVRQFLALVEVLPFADDIAAAAGEIRATLKKAGTPIGPYDLLIAAHAVRLGATLVTANVREFSRVPGLKWEDWSA